MMGKKGIRIRGGKVRNMDNVLNLKENIEMIKVMIGIEVDIMKEKVKMKGKIEEIERDGGEDGLKERMKKKGIKG